VTEAEWLACAKPDLMLLYLQRQLPKRSGRRKARLLVCTLCRLVWDHLQDPDGRHGVETAEQFVEGLVPSAEKNVLGRKNELGRSKPTQLAALTGRAGSLMWDSALSAAARVVKIRIQASLGPFQLEIAERWKQRRAEERRLVCELIRDVFQGPSQREIAVNQTVLTWKHGTVPKLAASIYDDHSFARLPILADALEDAGCADAEILGHLRGPGPHRRGCWALDLLLRKGG
jgi:hypothetical protein